MTESILIVKTGHSEFLDSNNQSKDISLGDVFRTTVLLPHYHANGDKVTWLTDAYASPLLEGNPMIDEIIRLDFKSAMNLLDRKFDTIVNLEKNREICEFVKRIDAWKKQGFRIDAQTEEIKAYDRAHDVLAVSTDALLKKNNTKTFQELLFDMIGKTWKGEEYVLGYQPKASESYDIGLNMMVGSKWPNKAWPRENWDSLEERLTDLGHSVTRQDKQNEEMFKNQHMYIDWLNKSKLIVSSDSLGMHLAIALGKKTLGLFAPTPSAEIYFYGRGEAMVPEPKLDCVPCFSNICDHPDGNCINKISVERVYNKVLEYLK